VKSIRIRESIRISTLLKNRFLGCPKTVKQKENSKASKNHVGIRGKFFALEATAKLGATKKSETRIWLIVGAVNLPKLCFSLFKDISLSLI
jgi:hypothetical protein